MQAPSSHEFPFSFEWIFEKTSQKWFGSFSECSRGESYWIGLPLKQQHNIWKRLEKKDVDTCRRDSENMTAHIGQNFQYIQIHMFIASCIDPLRKYKGLMIKSLQPNNMDMNLLHNMDMQTPSRWPISLWSMSECDVEDKVSCINTKFWMFSNAIEALRAPC